MKDFEFIITLIGFILWYIIGVVHGSKWKETEQRREYWFGPQKFIHYMLEFNMYLSVVIVFVFSALIILRIMCLFF